MLVWLVFIVAPEHVGADAQAALFTVLAVPTLAALAAALYAPGARLDAARAPHALPRSEAPVSAVLEAGRSRRRSPDPTLALGGCGDRRSRIAMAWGWSWAVSANDYCAEAAGPLRALLHGHLAHVLLDARRPTAPSLLLRAPFALPAQPRRRRARC